MEKDWNRTQREHDNFLEQVTKHSIKFVKSWNSNRKKKFKILTSVRITRQSFGK